MKTFRTPTGPFIERPYFTVDEIESTCTSELKSVELFPVKPSPTRIERFIEKKFKVTPEYIDLPGGVLGCTEFGSRGVKAIFISKKLTEENTKVAERRISSTLAHEAGHGIFHSYLFVLQNRHEDQKLFELGFDLKGRKILCKEEYAQIELRQERSYDGRWWEYQANLAIGALLLPRPLVLEALKPVLTLRGTFGSYLLEASQRDNATTLLADIFNVNTVVARIRVDELFPRNLEQQLTL